MASWATTHWNPIWTFLLNTKYVRPISQVPNLVPENFDPQPIITRAAFFGEDIEKAFWIRATTLWGWRMVHIALLEAWRPWNSQKDGRQTLTASDSWRQKTICFFLGTPPKFLTVRP